MRSSGNARHPNETDPLPLLNSLSFNHKDFLKMTVAAFETIVMFDANIVSISVTPTRKRHATTGDRPDWRSLNGAVINTIVFPPHFENRMQAIPIPGCNPNNAQR